MEDVVTLRVRGPEAVGARRVQAAVGDDAVEQGVGVIEELARGGLAQDRRDLPFISQARKKNCQSIISRSVARSGWTVRIPVNAGTGRSPYATRSRLARACSRVSKGRRWAFSCCSRSCS